MQEIIANLLRKLSGQGFSHDQIALYLQGLFDGMQLVCTQLKGNRLPVENDSDPVFVHNWNFILDSMAGTVETTIKDAFNSVESEMKNELKKRNTESSPVDKEILPNSRND
jgi:hypothetical protein